MSTPAERKAALERMRAVASGASAPRPASDLPPPKAKTSSSGMSALKALAKGGDGGEKPRKDSSSIGKPPSGAIGKPAKQASMPIKHASKHSSSSASAAPARRPQPSSKKKARRDEDSDDDDDDDDDVSEDERPAKKPARKSGGSSADDDDDDDDADDGLDRSNIVTGRRARTTVNYSKFDEGSDDDDF